MAAARFYAGYQKRDGFLNINTALGPNTNDRTDGPFFGIINALASIPPLGGQAGAQGVANPPLSPFSRQAYANQPISQQIRDMGISAELNWDLGPAKLTSITAWRDNTLVVRRTTLLRAWT